MPNLTSNPSKHNPKTLEIFRERCEARALLWAGGAMPLHEAVDGLQDYAVASGLTAKIGQDAVQEIMACAFEKRRIQI
jgi:hypothetical protein